MREYMHVDKKYLDEIEKLKDKNRFRSPIRNEGRILTLSGLRKTLLQFIVLFVIVGCLALFIAPQEHQLHLSVTIGGALLIGNVILMWIAFEQ